MFRCKSVRKGELYIRNSGAFVRKSEPDAFADSIDRLRDLKCATTTVFKSIATQFTGGRDNLGLIHKTNFRLVAQTRTLCLTKTTSEESLIGSSSDLFTIPVISLTAFVGHRRLLQVLHP